jgi:hypothetical protein
MNFKIEGNDYGSNDKITVKGKTALDMLHENISKESEKNVNLKISDIYCVDFDEANEIHINYHSLRIKNLIKKSDILNKMNPPIENYFDISTLASMVVRGEITENSCLDMLINAVRNKRQSQVKDRYINFYS